jgi:hypothetical protein
MMQKLMMAFAKEGEVVERSLPALGKGLLVMNVEPASFGAALAFLLMRALGLIAFLNGVVEVSRNDSGILAHSRRSVFGKS